MDQKLRNCVLIDDINGFIFTNKHNIRNVKSSFGDDKIIFKMTSDGRADNILYMTIEDAIEFYDNLGEILFNFVKENGGYYKFPKGYKFPKIENSTEKVLANSKKS